MKNTGKNNPIMIGVLLGILVVTLFYLVKQLNRGNPTGITLTPIADTHLDKSPIETGTIGKTVSQGEQRDPFDHPALHRIAKKGMPAQNLTPEAQIATEAARMILPGSKAPFSSANGKTILSPSGLADRTQVHTSVPIGAAPIATVPINYKPTGNGSNASMQATDDPLKGWHLTAIIAGQYPRAVIERAGIGPYQVGVGDRVCALQVTAIQEREIVLCDAHHLYTLPLMAASPMQEVNNDESSEKLRNTTSENANGTAKTHP